MAARLAWMPVIEPVAGAAAMLRNRLSVNRMIATTAVGSSDLGREAIMDQLERNLESGAKPIGMATVLPSPTPSCTASTYVGRSGSPVGSRPMPWVG